MGWRELWKRKRRMWKLGTCILCVCWFTLLDEMGRVIIVLSKLL